MPCVMDLGDRWTVTQYCTYEYEYEYEYSTVLVRVATERGRAHALLIT